jgi:oxygen-dependent protoporphyrinogen oxidase
MRSVDVIVLGAGLSGLSAADALAAAGHRVLVLDRRSVPGGRAQTERIGNFLFEHGPNSLAGPAPVAEGLIDRLGLAAARVERGKDVRHRYLVRNGTVHALPLRPLAFFSSSFFSLRGRLRLLAEPLVPSRTDDESVTDFVQRRFGRELLDYVVDPLIGGLHAGDPARLSTTALFPRLKALERTAGSVTGGLVLARLKRGRAVEPGPRTLFSFRDGMATLPRALAARLGDRLVSGLRVETVMPAAGGGFVVMGRQGDERVSLRAGAVVVALPAYAAAPALAGMAPDVAGALAGIAHPPLAVVFLGYRADAMAHPLDGLGFLAPSCERRPALGMLFSSTLFAGRAPAGHVALTAFVGGAREPDRALRPAAELEHQVAAEVRHLLGAGRLPVLARTRYWRYGLPQYEMGHDQRVAMVRRLEETAPGIFVTGNYLTGVSTVACIEQGLLTAARAGRYLESRATARLEPARAAGSRT